MEYLIVPKRRKSFKIIFSAGLPLIFFLINVSVGSLFFREDFECWRFQICGLLWKHNKPKVPTNAFSIDFLIPKQIFLQRLIIYLKMVNDIFDLFLCTQKWIIRNCQKWQNAEEIFDFDALFLEKWIDS